MSISTKLVRRLNTEAVWPRRMRGGRTRRVVGLVKATAESEAGILPSEELLAAMGAYNEELVNAGIMKAGEGLKPSATGKKIKFDGDKRTVIDGPFAEAKEMIAGFWLWEVKSMDEAMEWALRCPNPTGAD